MFDFHTTPFELKALGEDGSFEGYVAAYGNVDSGGDRIIHGAFEKSLAELSTKNRTVKLLFNHSHSEPIGVWESFTSDNKGLRGKGRILSDVQRGREVLALLRAGAVSGLSIGYRTKDSEYIRDSSGELIRHIKEAELWEASVVTFPMNEEATVTDVKQLSGPRDVENILRKSGVPGSVAKIIANHGYDEAAARLGFDQREADDQKADQLERSQAFLTQLKQLKEAFHG